MNRAKTAPFFSKGTLLPVLAWVFFVASISFSGVFFNSPSASAAETEESCKAIGGTWIPGNYAALKKEDREGKCNTNSQNETTNTPEKCAASGGVWKKPYQSVAGTCEPKEAVTGETEASCKEKGGEWDGSLAVEGDRCKINNAAKQQACKDAGVADQYLAECVMGTMVKSDLSYCTTKYPGNKGATDACYVGQSGSSIPVCLEKGYSAENGTLSACVNGNRSHDNAEYCSSTYSDRPNAGTLVAACKFGQTLPPPVDIVAAAAGINCESDPDSIGCQDGVASSCMVEAIGWIICPVVNFVGQLTDASYLVIAELLETPASMFNTSEQEGAAVYQAWGVMRTIANVAFVLAFLFIIFSQLTSVGISNYGVKKLVPKLVIAVILVNASFIISALAVDVSNIVGSNAKGLFDSISSNLTVAAEDDKLSAVFNGTDIMTNVTGGILAGTLIVGTSMYVGLAALLPVLIASALAVLLVVVVLLMRQALLVLLIVISPLAFVALLLPNTEGWFKKWRGLFFTLLAMFPIIGAIFGASALAGKVIMLSSTNPLVQMMGAAITLIPLVLTPVVMTAAGGLLNRFAGVFGDKEKGLFKGVKDRASDFRDRRQNTRAANALAGRPVFGGGQFRRANRRRLKNEEASSAMEAASAGFGMVDEKANASLNTITQNKLAGSAVSAARTQDINEGIVSDTIKPSESLGVAAAALPNIQAAVKQQAAKAVDEERKAAANKLSLQIATLKATGGDPDDYVASRANPAMDGTASHADRHAAMSYAASMGRSKVIDKLMKDPNVDQGMLQEAIGANAGGLLGKAPDLVKGPAAAFGTVNGAQMSKFSPDTADRQMDYMVKLHAEVDKHGVGTSARKNAEAALKQATDAFNGAIKDISLDTSLQADFTGDSGKSIRHRYDEAIKASGSFKTYAEANLKSIDSIHPDGKIR